jgi:hypothetical protein
VWNKHSEMINSRVKQVERLIDFLGYMFLEPDDDASTVLAGSDPLPDRQGDFPTESDASNTGNSAIHPRPQPGEQVSEQLDHASPVQLSSVDDLTPLGDSQTGCFECSTPSLLPSAQYASVVIQTSSPESSPTLGATTLLFETDATQTRYPLLSRKRSANEDSTPHSDERSSLTKRRHD